MKKVRVLCLIALSIFVLTSCNQDEEDAEEETRIVPVEVTEVKIGNMTDVQTLYGRITPQKTTPIRSDVPGEVDEVDVTNGDQVEKDDLIATIRTGAGLIRVPAPDAGEIAQLAIEEDELISPEEPLGVIIATEEMEITLQVTSAVRSLFSEEATYDATIDEMAYEAVVDVIDALPNDTGLYDIRLTVENEENDLIAGMVAAVDVTETRLTDALIVPTEAVIEESDGAFVYVVVDDQVERIDVEIQEMQTDKTAIEGDIKEGDQIVVNGQLTVTDGSKVEVVKVVNGS